MRAATRRWRRPGESIRVDASDGAGDVPRVDSDEIGRGKLAPESQISRPMAYAMSAVLAAEGWTKAEAEMALGVQGGGGRDFLGLAHLCREPHFAGGRRRATRDDESWTKRFDVLVAEENREPVHSF